MIARGGDCPVHLVVGEQETNISPDAVRAFATQSDDYAVTVMPGAGHLAVYEKPGECLRIPIGDDSALARAARRVRERGWS